MCLCGQIEDNKKICKGCQETLVGFILLDLNNWNICNLGAGDEKKRKKGVIRTEKT